MNKMLLSLTILAASFISSSQAQYKFVKVSSIPGNIVNDSAANTSPLKGRITVIGSDQRWTADNVYIVENLTFVEAPAVLTIEPGTIIRMEPSTTGGTSQTDPADVGAIIICRGAKIVAPGTAESPIIFTNYDDPFVPGGASTIPSTVNGASFTARNYASTTSGDITKFKLDSNCGGIVILGKTRLAFNNKSGTELTDPTGVPLAGGRGSNFIEGFQAIDGTVYGTAITSLLASGSASGGKYGGTDDNDNSGTMRFCSIRYGGFILSLNNEINGLTPGAVGRGTCFEFIEVYNNADDDIEPFGGTANFRYCAGLFGGDDGFDIDQGYRGNIQFWFQVQNNLTANSVSTGRPSGNKGDCTGEWDGPEAPLDSLPYTVHTMFNGTHIGQNGAAGKAINWKDNAGGKVFNSIFANASKFRFEAGTANSSTASVNGTTAMDRFLHTRQSGGEFNEVGVTTAALEPDAMIKYTTIQGGAGSSVTGYFSGANAEMNTVLGSSNLTYSATTPLVNQAATDGTLDPRLKTDASTERTSGIKPSVSGPSGSARSTWFVNTTHRGAFKDANWLSGWSILEKVGCSPAAGFPTATFPMVTVTRQSPGATAFARITFPVQNGVQYSVQVSTDGGKNFLPVPTATGLENGLFTASANGTATVDLAAGTGNNSLQVRVLPL